MIVSVMLAGVALYLAILLDVSERRDLPSVEQKGSTAYGLPGARAKVRARAGSVGGLLDEVRSSRWVQRLHAGVRRVVVVLQDEVSFDPRKALVHSVSSLLPQFRFCRVRTALLRAIGPRVGKGSGF